MATQSDDSSPELSALSQPQPYRSASTVSLITALPIQLAALAVVFRSLPTALDACLRPDPPPLAKWVLLGMGATLAIIGASTPNIVAVMAVVKRLPFIRGGGK